MNKSEEHWRWNADPVWHYFCSMQYEAARSEASTNDFMRYHHIRSCIYFAVGTVESFLNFQFRQHKQKLNTPENQILKTLKDTKLPDKISKWPSEMCGHDIVFEKNFDEVFLLYKNIRNEITHPKRKDHSIYLELDKAELNILIDAVAKGLVSIYEGISQPFPYWVLGWNYVGLNGNPAYPFLSNNINGFVPSLRNMGFSGKNLDIPDLSWDKKYMKNIDDYNALKSALDSCPLDIEPYWKDFPQKPRLTRKWWDHKIIYEDIEKHHIKMQ